MFRVDRDEEMAVTTETLSAVIGDVLQNNVKTGKLLIRAYRKGGHRAAHQLGKGFGAIVDKTGDALNAAQRTRVLHAGQRFAEFADKSVSRFSGSAEKALDAFFKGASQVVGQLNARADKFENPYASRYVEIATTLTLPTAKLARTVSEKLFEGTEKMAERFASRRPVARPARKARRAKRTVKAG